MCLETRLASIPVTSKDLVLLSYEGYNDIVWAVFVRSFFWKLSEYSSITLVNVF